MRGTRGTVLAIIATATASGCQGLPCRKPPAPCVMVERQEGCEGDPQARVEARPGGEYVIHVPPPKVVLDAPPAQCQAAPRAPAQCQPPAPAPSQLAAPAQAGIPVVPQGVMPGFVPQAVGGGIPLAMTGGLANAEYRERTGLGFVFDTVRIPIPIIRPVVVPKPARVTFQVPASSLTATGMTGFSASAIAPMGGMPMGMTGVPFAAGAPQLTPPQLALLQAALAQSASGGATGPSAGSAQSVGDGQLEELLQKCEELKKLKQLRQPMQSPGGEGK